MKIKKEEIVIQENDEVIGRIQKKQGLDPERSWIKKSEDGKIYELVIQSKNKAISMYTLTKNDKGKPKTTLNWVREDISK